MNQPAWYPSLHSRGDIDGLQPRGRGPRTAELARSFDPVDLTRRRPSPSRRWSARFAALLAPFVSSAVLAIVDEQEVTVVSLDTGEILSTHRIEPAKGYWRNTRRDPGRWPGSQATG